ncbi:MAG: futalosine hydrolase [Deltaproteobacteria bacterium]|nr:futalosine hydrolase [Deltaproteobacteria bacterium]MBW1922404.1 futalosine hydrolase [Deltaproteobacteria bacterium]MBW1948440.1 futalosine hydrolase [Deltaproteobacteria bacterium]MBW2009271.1 futalosine hydrolase [Deltaproteobacteria bacterium]MBW2347440.1 futalosine hydrolase [Deltaproteobacteria bacterium]
MTLCVFAAVRSELTLLISLCHAVRRNGPGGLHQEVYEGRAGGKNVTLAVVGVGLGSAALSIGSLLGVLAPRAAFMVGSAGALPGSGLETGDLLVCESEILAELGVVRGPGIGDARPLVLPGVRQEIPLDPGLSAALFRAGSVVGRVKKGPALTVVGVSAGARVAETRAERFGAMAENMEGYALALAGRRFGVPVGEIRGISNPAGDRDRDHWDFKAAREGVQRAVMEYLRSVPCRA